ncbi:hypothetical protein [Novosphingobium sp.]|uniref:hypothetical protein n=1 Tax=Novosphingobium sp. TaxID=1874826 RepID=UPI00333E5658
MTTQRNNQDAAREPRERRLIRAKMCSDRLPAHDILIRNISRQGLSATSRGVLPPMVDEQVSLRLPDGQVIGGAIRWVDGQVFGVLLQSALNLPAFFDALQRLKQNADTGATFEIKSMHRVTTWRPDESALRRV